MLTGLPGVRAKESDADVMLTALGIVPNRITGLELGRRLRVVKAVSPQRNCSTHPAACCAASDKEQVGGNPQLAG